MFKIVSLAHEEIIVDPEGAASALTKVLKRNHAFRFNGVCMLEHELLFVFEPSENGEEGVPQEFVLSDLESDGSEDGITAIISHRYFAGYSTLAVFPIDGRMWGLFRKEEMKAKSE